MDSAHSKIGQVFNLEKSESNKVSLIKLISILAFWEILIMLGFILFPVENTYLEALLDTVLLSVFSGVSIWYFIHKQNKARIANEVFEEQKFYNQIISAVDKLAAISIADHEGNIVFANENFCEISGYTQNELIGANYKILNSGHHDKNFFRQLWQTVKSGNSWRNEVRNKRKDGQFYWVDTYHTPISDGDKNIVNYFSIQFDKTDQKSREIELEEEKQKNIQMARLSSLGQMAGGVAHEINNPLSIISGFMSALERRLKGDEFDVPKMIELVDKVQTQTFRVSKIIKGLKDFSRNDDHQDMQMTPFRALADTVEILSAAKLKKSGVHIEVVSDQIEFLCHPVQIEQVLVNLISNAIDAVQNYDERWIRLECRQVGNYAEVSVTDSGKGIPEDIAKKMMNPFFTTKEVGRGTGLGLSISKGLIEKHLGRLEIDSTSANTRFVFRIPMLEQAFLDLIDIDQEIQTHLGWKAKILEQINHPHLEIDFSKLKDDRNCDLGKWLNQVNPFYKMDPLFCLLHKEHHLFHKYAGLLLQKIKDGSGFSTEKDFLADVGYEAHLNKVIAVLEKFKDRKA